MRGFARLLTKPFRILWLIVWFLYELVMSSIKVAKDVLTPGLGASPRLLAYPLEARSDVEITLTGNLITLTPGTLTVDVSPDRRFLLIHAMYTDEGVEAVNASIRNGLEKVVIGACR